LKFPVTWDGWAFKPDFGTVLEFENAIWEIPSSDQNAHFLSLRFEIPVDKSNPRKGVHWDGIIQIPAVQTPLYGSSQ
jgi:hypothetical protein